MKFAIVGCQHFHIKIFIDEMLELGHEFIGIYDNTDYFLPKQYEELYKVPLFDKLDELIDRGVDVVGNCVRNDKKIDIIEWGEKHGVHVMTDKPIANDFAALKRLDEVIKRGKIKVGMMLTERFSPPVYTLKKLMELGELGDIYDFTFLMPHKLNASQRPAWFFQKSINGGLIIDIMIHDIDLLRWMSGREMTDFHGILLKNTLFRYPDFYDNAIIDVLMEDAITATIKADWFMPQACNQWGDGRIFVTGSKGRAEIRSNGDSFGDGGYFLALTTNNKTEKVPIENVPFSLSGDFINQINNKNYLLNAEDIYRCNENVLRIDASSVRLSNGSNI